MRQWHMSNAWFPEALMADGKIRARTASTEEQAVVRWAAIPSDGDIMTSRLLRSSDAEIDPQRS